MTLFLHLASHRTGSTHFQAALARNRDFLAQSGWTYEKLQDIPDLLALNGRFRRLAARQAKGKDPSAAEKLGEVAEALATIYRERIVPGEGNRLLSYEGHLGEMNVIRSRGIYPGHAVVADFIRERLKGTDHRVGLSIRAYDDFIESGYKYLVRVGRTDTFAEYAQGVGKIRFDWVPIVRNLVATFGKENVLVWSFEQYRSDMEGFYDWFFARLGIENPKEPAGGKVPFGVEDDVSNASSSTVALDLELTINEILRDVVTSDKQRLLATKLINRELEARLDSRRFGRPTLLGDEIRQRLRSRYEDDLKQVAELAVSRV